MFLADMMLFNARNKRSRWPHKHLNLINEYPEMKVVYVG